MQPNVAYVIAFVCSIGCFSWIRLKGRCADSGIDDIMMQCHVAVSQDSNPQQAAQVVSRSVHDAFGGLGCDFACVFFSPHFTEDSAILG